MSRFCKSFMLTLAYTGGSVIGILLIGLGVALVLNREFRGRIIARSITIIPWAIPIVVVCLLLRLILDPTYGAMNGTLRRLGLIKEPILF